MDMDTDPVVISGVGLTCALGQGVDAAWPAMLRGEAVASAIPDAWLAGGACQSRAWAPLPSLDHARHGLGRADELRYDRVSMLSIGTCLEALDDAGLVVRPLEARGQRMRIEGFDAHRIGVYIGTGIGGIRTTLATHLFHAMKDVRDALGALGDDCAQAHALAERIRIDRRFNPLAVTMLMSNAVSAAPAVRLGITGPCRTTTLACASGTVAIGDACRAVARGEVDLALAGGAEYLFDEYGSIFRAYDITGALTRGIEDPARANRPFDTERAGFLFSEGGAGMVVVERASTARARGARPAARVIGFAESFDGHDLIAMAPDGAGIRAMLQAALADAGIDAASVDYLNAHGTGTEMNDRIELEVIGEIFGNDLLVNATKGLVGHTIGASGAIEAVVTALSIRDGQVHPCVNLDHPIAPMNFPRVATGADIGVAVSQSFAFGGHNACLVMARP